MPLRAGRLALLVLLGAAVARPQGFGPQLLDPPLPAGSAVYLEAWFASGSALAASNAWVIVAQRGLRRASCARERSPRRDRS
jgi:hypothetical protein